MSKLEERIAAAAERLKLLKARHARVATKQRARDARQQRRDELRRRVLVGAAVLELVERGEIEPFALAKWLEGKLANKEDRELFSRYWKVSGQIESVQGDSEIAAAVSATAGVGSKRGSRENHASE